MSVSLVPCEIKAACLADYTTFALGGPCRALWACTKPDELQAVVRTLQAAAAPYLLIGGGSNLLIDDAGLDVVVVRYFSDEPHIEWAGNTVTVSGATRLDHLARDTAAAGLAGVVCGSGIPGTVGGAIVGNAGAFGQQIGDVVEEVECLAPDGSRQTLSRAELGFAYRYSNLRHRRLVVLSARLRLQPTDSAELNRERARILELRRAKHPDWRTEPCIGSIFRNIEPSSAAGRRQAAGWFLEQAGTKAMRVGGAYVYPRHANIIVRDPAGTAHDVKELSGRMHQAVRDRFGLDLQYEVRFVGPNHLYNT